VNPRNLHSIRLDEYHILYTDNDANNTVLSLSCCNTYGKEEADANFAVVFWLLFQTDGVESIFFFVDYSCL
jgi:hypothetical protein